MRRHATEEIMNMEREEDSPDRTIILDKVNGNIEFENVCDNIERKKILCIVVLQVCGYFFIGSEDRSPCSSKTISTSLDTNVDILQLCQSIEDATLISLSGNNLGSNHTHALRRPVRH